MIKNKGDESPSISAESEKKLSEEKKPEKTKTVYCLGRQVFKIPEDAKPIEEMRKRYKDKDAFVKTFCPKRPHPTAGTTGD